MVTGDRLRIVFFGTPEFAVPTLDALLQSLHPVVGVVTRADRPRGRGHKTTAAPVKVRAADAGLPLLRRRLADQRLLPDLGIARPGRFTDAVLAVPRLGLLNVHASLLPQYRGAAPIHRAIINGDGETGVTIMRVVKALDAGPMLADVRRPVGADETSEEVERDLAGLGADLLVSSVDALAAGRAQETPQDDAAATYAHRLTKGDGLVDWAWPAQRIHNLIRGLHPWPHAFTFLGGHRFILRRSTTSPESPAVPPGTVLEMPEIACVASGAGTLNVVEIQPEGKRPMAVREFLAGHRIAQGDVFSSQP